MANGENRDQIIRALLQIGKEYLWPIARDAFYEYRDRILSAYKVGPEERAELLGWIFDDGEEADPNGPLPVNPAPYMEALEPPIPDDAELLARGYKVGDRIVPDDDSPRWFMVRKGQPLLDMKVLRTIGEE